MHNFFLKCACGLGPIYAEIPILQVLDDRVQDDVFLEKQEIQKF